MTGEPAFRQSDAFVCPKEAFPAIIDSLRARYRVFGPVRQGGEAVFGETDAAGELFMEYSSTMAPPGKTLFFRPRQEILSFGPDEGLGVREVLPASDSTLIVGIHPCDVHAVVYLDRVFACDPYYRARRDGAMLIALNCRGASEFCFCSSVGTGPHLSLEGGYDALLTDLGEDYLVEPKSAAGAELFDGRFGKAGEVEWTRKGELERDALGSFRKRLDLGGVDALLRENLDHPVWARTAEEWCLSCANCVMVCPTCFCHDYEDVVAMDLASTSRRRRWDACQDMRFAAVHGGNFRRTRAARLRQFVMHKLDYSRQFGTAGTVGCGRCIRWCPTGIDLTEMAKEIQASAGNRNGRDTEKPASSS
jgi:sulfhydrogenase subunit beta (sulfur reductase)